MLQNEKELYICLIKKYLLTEENKKKINACGYGVCDKKCRQLSYIILLIIKKTKSETNLKEFFLHVALDNIYLF